MKKILFAALPLMAAASVAASAHAGVQDHAKVIDVAPQTQVEFNVYLPLRNTADLDRLLAAQQTPGSSSFHKWLTPDEFKARFGPTEASMDHVRSALEATGLRVVGTHTQLLRVAGTAAQINAAFQTRLGVATTRDGKTHTVAATPLITPSALDSEGARIAAFAGIPERHTFSHMQGKIADNRYGPDGPYWYNDMKQAYDYPSYTANAGHGQNLDGTGSSVAILMEDLPLQSDVDLMFTHEHFTVTTTKAPPTFAEVDVNGGGRVGGPGSVEASLDVQQVLGGAPGASVTMVNIPNLSDDNIASGYMTIIDANSYDLVNSSFGGCELDYTAAYNGGTDYTYILQNLEDIFKQGNAQGITFVASSGDQGGLLCPNLAYFNGDAKHAKFVKGVSSPSDSPSVTSVGGGNLVTKAQSSKLGSHYVAENSYGDPMDPYDIYGFGIDLKGGIWGSGGGVSEIFGRPSYQKGMGVHGRAQPDVGMQVGGCPQGSTQPCGPDRSAAVVAYEGGLYGVIGTSVSSPEFVGALALYKQTLGTRLGNINGFLYARGMAQDAAGGSSAPANLQYFHKNVPGFDGVYTHTADKYDYMIGNGTPDVRMLFDMTDKARAAKPRTSSNP